jgi:predicted DsbA family dithiol-disulfide isomerase
MSDNVNIDIVSDLVCPWCYVGQKRLKVAIQQFKQEGNDTNFTIKWKPFLLNPNTPKQGNNRAQYFKQRFGISDLKQHPMSKHLLDAGESVDIHFQLDKPEVVSSSIDGHRLLDTTLKQDGNEKQDQVAADLFSKYFEQGIDIGNDDILKQVAETHNVKLPEDFFTNEQQIKEIKQSYEEAQLEGVTGVPFFTFYVPHNSQRFTVSGAQNPSTFLQILKKITRK